MDVIFAASVAGAGFTDDLGAAILLVSFAGAGFAVSLDEVAFATGVAAFASAGAAGISLITGAALAVGAAAVVAIGAVVFAATGDTVTFAAVGFGKAAAFEVVEAAAAFGLSMPMASLQL